MLENENNFKIVAFLLGGAGVMFGAIIGLAVFIFREHIKDNHRCFSRNDHEHDRIEDKIDCKEDKKWKK
jgi:ABC-type branched-subunit amino acid transport system permease subunit